MKLLLSQLVVEYQPSCLKLVRLTEVQLLLVALDQLPHSGMWFKLAM
jgi:hypothetical protein